MANLGLLGALGGFGEGLVAQAEEKRKTERALIDEARDIRLERIRARTKTTAAEVLATAKVTAAETTTTGQEEAAETLATAKVTAKAEDVTTDTAMQTQKDKAAMARTKVSATKKAPFSARLIQDQFTGEQTAAVTIKGKALILLRRDQKLWNPLVSPEEQEEILIRPNLEKALRAYEKNKADPEASRVFFEIFKFLPESYLGTL